MEQILDVVHATPVAAFASRPESTPPPAMPRFDIYVNIHKGLRAAMTDAMLAAGRLDAGDSCEITDTVVRIDALLDLCKLHLEKENTYVHPAMEARCPGSTRRIADEHVDHKLAFVRLRWRLDALTRAPAANRAAVAHDLYRELSLFVGENLVHMHEEETAHNAVLWDCYSDAELAALEDRIKADLTPAQMQQAMRWMLPAMTPAQRAGMFTHVRSAAPAPVFEGLLAAARALLDANGLRKLEAALTS
jgi:hypothetical protein